MSELIFFTNPMSRGRIVRWMLEETGVAYDTRVLDYASSMAADDYRAVNPMSKVPAIIHDGRVVTECAAICAYLADAFSQAELAPREEEKAGYYRWLFFAAGPVEQAVTNHTNGWDPPPERTRMFGYGSFDRTIETLADHVAANRFVCGDRFTAADVYVGSQVLWGTQFGTIPARPCFADYAERLAAREAYGRAKLIDDRLIAEMAPKEIA